MRVVFWNGREVPFSVEVSSREEAENLIGEIWFQNEHIELHDWSLNILGREIIK